MPCRLFKPVRIILPINEALELLRLGRREIYDDIFSDESGARRPVQ